MEQRADESAGGFEIWLTSPSDPDYVPPPRPEPGPLSDSPRPHVEAVRGDMQQPTPVKLQLGYYPDDDELEHFGVVLFTETDGSGFGFGVVTNAPEADLLIALAEGLQENFSETVKPGAKPDRPAQDTRTLRPLKRSIASRGGLALKTEGRSRQSAHL
jgi:hypothetical protein